MDYKKLFNKTYSLLRQPRTEWQNIMEQEKDNIKVMNDFVLPMVGLCALSAFLGQIFQSSGFERALIAVIISIGKNLGGVYLTFFILEKTAKYFGLERNKSAHMILSGYGFVTIFVVDIVHKLIPEFFFLPILQFYLIYIIWEASDLVVKIEDKKRVAYVIFVSAIILILSISIDGILSNTIKASSEIIA